MANFLVVDDSSFMRVALGKTLISLGHEIIGEAKNGEEAIQRYIELKPDFVTMDIVMDKVCGIEALKRIKVIDPNAKIIMCSSISHQFKVIEALKAGADGFIVKPIKLESVIEVLNRILRNS